MTNAIFISYRRNDSSWATRSLHEALSSHFGEENVFIDLDDIPYGLPFSDKLEREAGRCDALVAVIGPDWLNARDGDGNRRLDDPDDWARREIALGLARRIPVVPILVNGAQMPKEEQLPDNLKSLSKSNAIIVGKDSFRSDIARLCRSLDQTLGVGEGDSASDKVQSLSSHLAIWIGTGAAAIAAIIGGLFLILSNQGPDINIDTITTESGGTTAIGERVTINQRDPTLDKVIEVLTAQLGTKDLKLQQKEEQILQLTAAVNALAQQKDKFDAPRGIADALAKLAEGDTEAAEQVFQQIADRKTQDIIEAAQAYRHIGSLAFLHDTNKALNAYRRATELDPDNADAWNQLGQLLLRVGDSHGAKEAYQTVLSLGEARNDSEWRARAYSNLGIVYKEQGHYKKAEDMYHYALDLDRVLKSLGGLAATYGNLGHLYFIQTKLEKAEDFYEKSISTYKKEGNIEGIALGNSALGNVLYKRGNLDAAEMMHHEALAIFKDTDNKLGMAAEYNQLGLIAADNRNYDKATSLFQQALDLYNAVGHIERLASVYRNLGTLYNSQSKFVEAEALFLKAVELHKTMDDKQALAISRYTLGKIRSRQGKYAQSEKVFVKALAIYEDLNDLEGQAETSNQLAWIYATAPADALRNGGKAVEMALRAINIQPEDHRYLDTYAAALAEANRFPDAINMQSKAIDKLSKDDPQLTNYRRRLTAYENGISWKMSTPSERITQ